MATIYFILFAIAIYGSAVESVRRIRAPKSPCPDIFQYAHNYVKMVKRGNPTFAYITLQKDGQRKAKLELNMQLGGMLTYAEQNSKTLKPFVLELLTSPEDLKDYNKKEIQFRLTINPTRSKSIPQPYEIKLNNRVVCQGPEDDFAAMKLGMVIEATLEDEITEYISEEDEKEIFFNKATPARRRPIILPSVDWKL